MFTHFQVFIKESQWPKKLQVMVLFPATVQTLRMTSCLPAAPPVHQPPSKQKGVQRVGNIFILKWSCVYLLHSYGDLEGVTSKMH